MVLAASAIGLFAAVGFAYFRELRTARERETEGGGEDRIQALIASLNRANEVIRELEVEIRTRQEVAEKLQADAEQAERFLQLNREELEAVRGLVGSELKRESRRSFWLGALVNFVFFVAGAGLTLLLS